MKSHCHLCGNETLEVLPAYHGLRRVTSDCKPWRSGGSLAVCPRCLTVQVGVDDTWREDARLIYSDYAIYAQALGNEQQVFDLAGGEGIARSDVLVRHLADDLVLPEKGNLLDVGCGNGGFLRSFSRRFQGWTLSGCEFDDRHAEILRGIPGFTELHIGDVGTISGEFDLISVIHTLEHIENPRPFLASIAKRLKPDGFLFIEVPCYVDNPFELLIADHATHFDEQSLAGLLVDAGFEVVSVSSDWVRKELSLIARPARVAEEKIAPLKPAPSRHLEWLSHTIRDARDVAAQSGSFGIFGSSIAATWLWSELERADGAFIDEDSARAGRSHLGWPIVLPSQFESGDVYVPLPPQASRAVAGRLSTKTAHYHPTPDGRTA